MILTRPDVEASPAIACFRSSFTQGMATYPCWITIHALGTSTTMNNLNPKKKPPGIPEVAPPKVYPRNQGTTWDEIAENEARHHRLLLSDLQRYFRRELAWSVINRQAHRRATAREALEKFP